MWPCRIWWRPGRAGIGGNGFGGHRLGIERGQCRRGSPNHRDAGCADEVSAVVASLFARHAQAYQALSLQATAFHQQFVQALTGAGGAYAAAEAVNAAVAQSVQQDVLNVINAPTQALFDR